MNRTGRCLLITFVESFATILVQRGVYFYSASKLGFSDAQNLWVALLAGGTYVAAALLSHRLTVALGERRVVRLAVAGQLLVHVALAFFAPIPAVVVVAAAAIGLFSGAKWPVMESFVAAGRTPRETAAVMGRFNLCWASAIPLSLAATGPIIAHIPAGLFVLAGVLNAASLILARRLPARPVHLAEDHPERLADGERKRLAGLLAASRWQLLVSYSLLWILAALLPHVFSSLGFAVAWAAAMAGLIDAVRVVAFGVFHRWQGWHGRVAPLVVAMAAMPTGFFMILFGPNLAVVLAGELILGFATGMAYSAALYYAMVVHSASVDAGGAHEALIGTGFVVGPAAQLAGLGLAGTLGGVLGGTIAGVGPLIVLAAAGSLWALRRPG